MTGARPDTWMPLYWGDYLRDTGHLSTAEHGAYFLLIGHYWTSGKPLPDDDEYLRRIARMTAREWRVSRETLAGFFTISDGLWHHGRVGKELEDAEKSYADRCARTKAATEARRQRNEQRNEEPKSKQTDNVTTNVTRTQPQPQPQSSLRSEESDAIASGAQAALTNGEAPKSKRGTRLPSDWEPSADDRAFAAEHGFLNGTCDALAAEFRDYWIAVSGQRGVKLDWSATFRNRVRAKAGGVPKSTAPPSFAAAAMAVLKRAEGGKS